MSQYVKHNVTLLCTHLRMVTFWGFMSAVSIYSGLVLKRKKENSSIKNKSLLRLWTHTHTHKHTHTHTHTHTRSNCIDNTCLMDRIAYESDFDFLNPIDEKGSFTVRVSLLLLCCFYPNWNSSVQRHGCTSYINCRTGERNGEKESITKSKHVFCIVNLFTQCKFLEMWTIHQRKVTTDNTIIDDNSPAESHHREYNNRRQFTSGKSPPRIQ